MKWIQKKAVVSPNDNDSIEEKIAKIRGIKDINRFLSPTKDELFDPYLIKNIEDASNRIIKAIANGENIVVGYDPDADGVASTTIMRRYLGNYTDKVDYIYGERGDGHGIEKMITLKGLEEGKDDVRITLNKENIKKIQGANLLILIDSSSNDAEACKYISKTWGVDIVIIDHHDIEKENPHVILVNPKQEGDAYPNKQLSGAGVVYKVLEVMEDTLEEVDYTQYSDLVAVGMYADIMRIDVFENRYLILNGLRNIQNTGLMRILKSGKIDLFKIDCNAIGFTVAPLINGVTRMDNIKLAIDMLMEDDDKVCQKIQRQMKKVNETKKEKQKEITTQYATKVDISKKVLLVLDEQSSRGYNGIVAQQLMDKYKRPALVGRLHKGVASGSFRSSGIDFKEFLLSSGLVDEAVGHPQAGGFTIKEENLEALEEYINNNLPELESKEPTVYYDLEINVEEIPEYVRIIERFNLLTGNGFYKIITRVNGISVEDVNVIGKTQETVKIKTMDDLELIKFRVNEDYASDIGVFDTIDAVGQLSMNEFYHWGLKEKIITPQIIIDDYRLV